MYKRLGRLWFYLNKTQKLLLVGVILLMIFAAAAEAFSIGVLLPFLGVLLNPELAYKNPYLLIFIEEFKLFDHHKLIWAITFAFVFAALFAALVRMLMVWSQIGLAYRIGSDLGEDIYRRILFQPYSFHMSINSSQVIADVSKKADHVVSEIILPCLVVVSSVVLIFGIGSMLAILNPFIAASSGLGFGLIYIVVMISTKFRVSRYGDIINKQQTLLIKTLQEAIGSIRDIIIDGAQEMYLTIYKRTDKPLRQAQAKNLIIGAFPRYLIEGVSVALIAIFCCWLASKEGGVQALIPTMGVLVLGAQKVLPLLQLAYVNFTQIRGGQSALSDVLNILDKPLPYVNKSIEILFKEKILLRGISYRYPDDSKLILKDIFLQINKGDRIGIVGSTGSGKSTLLDLIMGLLVPERGNVIVDGVFINSDNCNAWQRHIAHVPQSIYLTDSSVMENIAFGVPLELINIEKVEMAAKKAHIADVIESWDAKYMTNVGERGARLSGGQMQRIGLARALYRNANLIILDEATSALDNETEFAIMSTINELDSEITILIVAHRLTTLKSCNKIVRIENGEIVTNEQY